MTATATRTARPRRQARPAGWARPAGQARIDPRLRARRVAVRRAEGARRRRRLVAALAVVAALTLAAAIAWSPLLSVHRVVVRGAGSQAAAVRQAAHLGGGPMVLVRTGAVAASVEELPWVASARVERQFPTTVTITVTARTPVAWAPAGPNRVALVDGHGVVSAFAATAPPGLPQLAGLTRVPGLGGRVAPTAPAEAAAALGPTLAPRVSAVALTAAGLLATVTAGPQIRFGDATALRAKAAAAAAVLGALVHPATYLDVSVPSAPVAG